MLAELPEREATGDIAVIYDEIRRFCAVPYVSSMQRHLATRPGWLEWRGVLDSLGTRVGDEPFLPGLYRMLARWPHFLAHLATVLGPRFGDAGTRTTCQCLLDAIDAEVPAVFAALPALPERPAAPARAEVPDVLAALDTCRVTSPEMVVFSLMIRNALPATRWSGPRAAAAAGGGSGRGRERS